MGNKLIRDHLVPVALRGRSVALESSADLDLTTLPGLQELRDLLADHDGMAMDLICSYSMPRPESDLTRSPVPVANHTVLTYSTVGPRSHPAEI